MLSLVLAMILGIGVGATIEMKKDIKFTDKLLRLAAYAFVAFAISIIPIEIISLTLPYKYEPSGKEITYLVSVNTKEGTSGNFLHFDSDSTYKYFYNRDGLAQFDTISKSFALVIEDESEKPYF